MEGQPAAKRVAKAPPAVRAGIIARLQQQVADVELAAPRVPQPQEDEPQIRHLPGGVRNIEGTDPDIQLINRVQDE